MIIGTWNITASNGKGMEIIEEMERFDLRMLGYSETKKVGSEVNLKLNKKFRFNYSGINPRQRAKERMGVIISDDINKKLVKLKLR